MKSIPSWSRVGLQDYVYAPCADMTFAQATQYNDIGPLLGRELARLFQARKVPMVKPMETIRATVIWCRCPDLGCERQHHPS